MHGNKHALLIGVTQYGSDFSPLPAARRDVEAMTRVLRDPERGRFTHVFPIPDPDIEQKRIRLEGEMPSVINPPSGCRFSTRCPRYLGKICNEQEPPNQQFEHGHMIKCHIPLEDLMKVDPIFHHKDAAE